MNARAGGGLGLPSSWIRALLAIGALAGLAPRAQAAPVCLELRSARTDLTLPVPLTKGDLLAVDFKYIINVDNTGDPTQPQVPDCTPADPAYPANCNWPSIRATPGSSPIYTQGDQTDFASPACLDVPAGKYLISVLADGYKLDGRHFTVPVPNLSNLVTVELQPHPLPAATIQAAVFEDNATVNGAPDVPAERGLAGFQGHITDYIDFVTTDVFGQPLCTEYTPAGDPIPGTGGICLSKCYVVSGAVDIGTVAPVDGDGRCPIDATGIAATLEGTPIPAGAAVMGKLKIPNLGPNRYAVSVVPPNGTSWVQTTTLEGNLDWDNWVMEGATGLDQEFVQAGEPFPWSMFGYVKPTPIAAAGAGVVKGVVDAVKVYVPAQGGVTLPGTIWGGLAGAKIDKPVPYPWIALTGLQVGSPGAGGTIFLVQYRRNNAGAYQVRGGALTAGGTTFTNYFTVSNATHYIEIAWRAANAGTPRFQLYTDGTLRQSLNVDTSASRLESVRLGPSAGLIGTASGTIRLDAFASTRTTVIGP